MHAYSMDLRQRVIEAVERREETQTELARLFHVSLSWLVKLLGRWRRTGDLAPLPHGGGRERCVDASAEDVVEDLLRQQPDLTLAELQTRLAQRTGTHASIPTLCRVCQALGWPRKKKGAPRPRTHHPGGAGPAARLAGPAGHP